MAQTTTEPTGWYWLGTVAIGVVLASLVAYLVLQALRRARARRDAVAAHRSRLPEQYRFQREPLPVRLLLYALVLIVGIPAGLMFEGLGLSLAVLAVAMPFFLVAQRHRATHRQEVIAAVKEKAPAMTSTELEELVDALESEHGITEMKQLRTLLADRQPATQGMGRGTWR